MFLELIKRRNPNLIKAAVYLHQNGLIPPNTFILDADQIFENVKFLKKEASRWGLSLYFMLKQIRNPQIINFILDRDIPQTVCVDTDGARVIWENGFLIGHVGHLVQIPKWEIRDILLMEPEVITVFSAEKARMISEEAKKINRAQDLLLRVCSNNDLPLPGMEGGIPEENLMNVALKIKNYENVRIVGVTNFPAMLYSNNKEAELAPNFYTTLRCADKLSKLGFEIKQINAPGQGCTFTFESYSKAGATHVEPGHGITGTTPFSLNYDLPEIPAVIYVTEVLHNHNDVSYVSGGVYSGIDKVKKSSDNNNSRDFILFGKNEDEIFHNKAKLIGFTPPGKEVLVDYYGLIKSSDKKIKIGDTVVYGYRPQTFATRCSKTAVVRGIKNGNYSLMGVYDHCCHRLNEWP